MERHLLGNHNRVRYEFIGKILHRGAVAIMPKTGRYCLQRLVYFDPESRLETWKITNLKSDSVHAFSNFNTELYRIFDTLENKVIPFIEIKNNLE
jgi:hypothetical protein